MLERGGRHGKFHSPLIALTGEQGVNQTAAEAVAATHAVNDMQVIFFGGMPSVIIKRTETQVSRLCVFSLLQPHRTEVRLTGKYRYLTFEDRKKIEAWHLLGDRPVDIAARLSVHHTTIYKELQRGATGALDANQREGYSAELAERRLRESFKRRGKRAPAAQ